MRTPSMASLVQASASMKAATSSSMVPPPSRDDYAVRYISAYREQAAKEAV